MSFILSAMKLFFILFTTSTIETVYLKQKLVDVAKYHNTTMKQLLITFEVELSKVRYKLRINFRYMKRAFYIVSALARHFMDGFLNNTVQLMS